jgi:hypothetical protein
VRRDLGAIAEKSAHVIFLCARQHNANPDHPSMDEIKQVSLHRRAADSRGRGNAGEAVAKCDAHRPRPSTHVSMLELCVCAKYHTLVDMSRSNVAQMCRSSTTSKGSAGACLLESSCAITIYATRTRARTNVTVKRLAKETCSLHPSTETFACARAPLHGQRQKTVVVVMKSNKDDYGMA